MKMCGHKNKEKHQKRKEVEKQELDSTLAVSYYLFYVFLCATFYVLLS